MACLSYLLQGIPYDCTPNLAGIKQLLLTYKDNVNVTINRDTNTAYVSLVSGEWYEYSFGRNGASMSASMVKDEPSNSKYYSYSIELSFNKLTPEKNVELYALADEKLVAIVVDNNDRTWFLGVDGYLNASVEELTTGSGYGDKNGYNVTLNGSSRSLPFTYSNEPAPTPTVTGISFTLTWVTDVPASGGTASKNNCTYTVTSHLSDGTSVDVTSQATISGSASVPASSDTNRHSAGTLTLTATYGGFSSVTNTTIYQAGNDSPVPPTPSGATVTAITLSNCVLHKDVPASGIPSTGYTITTSDCTYTITGHYSDGTSGDITSIADCFGTTVVYCGDNTGTTRRQVGTLTLQAHYEGLFDYETVPIYQEAASPSPTPTSGLGEYLTFEVLSADTIGKVSFMAQTNSGVNTVIQYSKDNGSTWTSISPPSTASPADILVNTGDVIWFRGDNNVYDDNVFSTNCQISIRGNIMSLINSTNFSGLTTLASARTFAGLFINCSGITDASNLLLPATALTQGCYTNMFYGCSGLTSAPSLPATSLAQGCYQGMFINCISLGVAPDLPATTLVDSCYQQMFAGCSNLYSIKCLATDISASYCTHLWHSGVRSRGTFYKNPSMSTEDWGRGATGIPSYWTVQDAT